MFQVSSDVLLFEKHPRETARKYVMRDLEKEKRTYRDTRYGCLIEIVILVLFIGLFVHFILTIIRNIP